MGGGAVECRVVARPDDVEGSVEMALDGAERQAGGGGDLGYIHLFEEAEEEDGALAVGEFGDRVPDKGDLLLGDDAGLGRGGVAGQAGGDVGDVDCGVGGVFPEAETAGAGVIAGEIEGDADEPGGDGAVLAEAGPGGPGAEEGLLGEGFGGVAVAELCQQEAEDAGLVESDDGCEVVERGGAGVGSKRETGGREGLDVFRHRVHSLRPLARGRLTCRPI